MYQRNDQAQEKVSGHFEVPGSAGNVGLIIHAPTLQNNWLDVEIELINETTGVSFPVEKTIEYYSGVDSDGAWSEGSHEGRVIVPAVPPGSYHMAIEATAGPGPAALPYQIVAQRGVPVWSNFWVAVGMVLIFPLLMRWRQYAFELTRWSESDYSPYPQQQDGDCKGGTLRAADTDHGFTRNDNPHLALAFATKPVRVRTASFFPAERATTRTDRYSPVPTLRPET